MSGTHEQLAVEEGAVFIVPSEAFREPFARAHLEASCYPLSDGGYRTTLEPAYGLHLDGKRPWGEDWPTYGSLWTEGNPNGSLEKVLGKELACNGLYLASLWQHDHFLVTPDGGICRRYSVSIDR